MRSSCSLSMLHNPQYSNTVRGSKSSDNLHRITTASNGNGTLEAQPHRLSQTKSNGSASERGTNSPRKSSIFTLRRSRNKEKKRAQIERHKLQNLKQVQIDDDLPYYHNFVDYDPPSTMSKLSDPMTQSWHSQANGRINGIHNNNHILPTKAIFSLFRKFQTIPFSLQHFFNERFGHRFSFRRQRHSILHNFNHCGRLFPSQKTTAAKRPL
ncbi:hypothetical protein WR25_11796 [Diploscapter pachys]|uniref:Uncharacterized protein n=1 Tax=Diploscapter pachys TaxID=2018661 RepID=A0A2A2LR48_9BILA|nr:hypothetical protein WR25_11796 [Diploscapter pachys]